MEKMLPDLRSLLSQQWKINRRIHPVRQADQFLHRLRSQIIDQRNRGAAVLLVSEDLDEILELSDRVAVMSEGKITYVSPIAETDRATIGRHMGGH